MYAERGIYQDEAPVNAKLNTIIVMQDTTSQFIKKKKVLSFVLEMVWLPALASTHQTV